jgi:prephenate dehydratase
MPEPQMMVFAGSSSQTGRAAGHAYPGTQAIWQREDDFDDICRRLASEPVLAFLPMWNSHGGEIKPSKALAELFEDRARLHDLWPERIEWQCIQKDKGAAVCRITSVSAAEPQCSRFIAESNAKFIGNKSTVKAYQEFRSDSTIDAALCAPGQNTDGFNVVADEVSNPVNFTTFALLGHTGSIGWADDQFGCLRTHLITATRCYCGIEMPAPQEQMSEAFIEILSALTRDVQELEEVPQVVFVTEREPGTCGLVIETDIADALSSIMDEGGPVPDLKIHAQFGRGKTKYSKRVYEFLRNAPGFAASIDKDFVRHIGDDACFFACPVFEIMTHGADLLLVESVVRWIINKYFELIDIGVGCSEQQRTFFEKYRDAYHKRGASFVTFEDVGLPAAPSRS